jgi:hypothetical protein
MHLVNFFFCVLRVLCASASEAVRGFCLRCGTQLTFQRDDSPQEIDVTLCSLDTPAGLVPEDHTYTRSRLPWVRLCDGLPTYPTAREGQGQ